MKKTITISLLLVSFSVCHSKQKTDTLDYFNIKKVYVEQKALNAYSLDKKQIEAYDLELQMLLKEKKDHYSFWNGKNSEQVSMFMPFSKKGFITGRIDAADVMARASMIGTDYFEIHFAKQYMDSTYLMELCNQGRALFEKMLTDIVLDKHDRDYIEVLKKTQKMISEEDFYLMIALAKRLNRQVCFMRIDGRNKKDTRFKDKFYLLLSSPELFVENNKKYKFFRPMSLDEIPTHYVIRDKFDQF